MQKDIIYKQAAVELAMKYCPDDDGAVQCDRDIRGLLDELENLPSAQPERKTGKWVDDTYCSECGWVHTTEPGFIGSVEGFNFCPNCGADMRKGK